MAARGNRKTLAQQALALGHMPLTSSVTITRGRLLWQGQITPTRASRTFMLRMSYDGRDGTPSVTVVRPELRSDDVRRLPHVYPDDELCLCYPREWNAGKLIAYTIIPWAAEWLVHYEIFLVTGTWHGGGHEPAVA
jgi:hypothetical protein